MASVCPATAAAVASDSDAELTYDCIAITWQTGVPRRGRSSLNVMSLSADHLTDTVEPCKATDTRAHTHELACHLPPALPALQQAAASAGGAAVKQAKDCRSKNVCGVHRQAGYAGSPSPPPIRMRGLAAASFCGRCARS